MSELSTQLSTFAAVHGKKKRGLDAAKPHEIRRRRERDSNPRTFRSAVFKTAAFRFPTVSRHSNPLILCGFVAS